MLKNYAAQDWPKDCLALAGCFPDFPLREDHESNQPADTACEAKDNAPRYPNLNKKNPTL